MCIAVYIFSPCYLNESGEALQTYGIGVGRGANLSHGQGVLVIDFGRRPMGQKTEAGMRPRCLPVWLCRLYGIRGECEGRKKVLAMGTG